MCSSDLFFLYLAHWDVHGPHRALKEEVDKYKKKSQGWDNATNEKPNPVYAAMITAVDEPMPIHHTKFTMAQPHATGWFNPQTPTPVEIR